MFAEKHPEILPAQNHVADMPGQYKHAADRQAYKLHDARRMKTILVGERTSESKASRRKLRAMPQAHDSVKNRTNGPDSKTQSLLARIISATLETTILIHVGEMQRADTKKYGA